MSTAGQQRESAGGPAGWVILLGLMVLALAISWISKGCGDSDENATGGSPTTTAVTSTTGTAGSSAGQKVVTDITEEVRKAGGIQFVTGSADLTSASKTTLDAVAGILNRTATVNVQVDGHTDTQGDATANKALSQRRAQAVVDYLVSKGVAANRLVARGFGEESPLVSPDETEAARKQNRRVEFKLGA